MQHPKHQIKKRAVTLTELLVVVVIISLLATIAVPVYVNKAEQARIATAIQETRELANAEEQCAIAHGVYMPLQVLDDNPKDWELNLQNSDDINNTVTRGTIFIIYATQPILQQSLGQASLTINGSLASQNIIKGWKGPFVNVNRAAFADEIQRSGIPNDEKIAYDFPLDPWGTPYRLYSPLGLVGSGAWGDYATFTGNFSAVNRSFSDGMLTQQSQRFDRFAVVSFGPDRTSGTAFGDFRNRDDIYHLFGGIYTESSFQAFYR